MENINNVRRYTEYALRCGMAPVVPHFYALCVDDRNPEDRDLGMKAGLQLMDMCDEIWVFGTERSRGMLKEIDYATRVLRIPICLIDLKTVDDFLARKGGCCHE